jgi:hypothetical protein
MSPYLAEGGPEDRNGPGFRTTEKPGEEASEGGEREIQKGRSKKIEMLHLHQNGKANRK